MSDTIEKGKHAPLVTNLSQEEFNALVRDAMQWRARFPELLGALKDAYEHLEYCGYGDKWERECATESKLPQRISAAISKAEAQR